MNADMDITRDDLSWTAGLLNVHENPEAGFWLLYVAVVVMCIIVFNLGFARKLPLLKNVIVYGVLFIGAIPITIFAIGMPIVESLMAASVVLAIYKVRLHLHKKEQAQEEA